MWAHAMRKALIVTVILAATALLAVLAQSYGTWVLTASVCAGLAGLVTTGAVNLYQERRRAWLLRRLRG